MQNNSIPESAGPEDPKSTSISKRFEVRWRELAKLESGLEELRQEAAAAKDTGEGFCANYFFKRWFLPRLHQLVGWGRKHGDLRLRTSSAYRVAYLVIYEGLPDCRRCGCVNLMELIQPEQRSSPPDAA